MSRNRLAALVPVVVAFACVPPEVTRAALSDSAQQASTTSCVPNPGKVDVLLVIDDSASMGEESEALATNLANFMFVYEIPAAALDYRIAVTTTSVAGAQCTDSPEGGALLATPCTQRLDDFVTSDSHESPALDLRHVCHDRCSLASLPITPTAVVGDTGPERPRPWLERHVGQHNYPDDVDPAELLACMGQVGVAGCVYESPLEAARLALARMQDPQDPAFGFMRDDAALFVMFIGDEGDCSVRQAHADLFAPDGDTSLWATDEPTSAICWRAGVSCEGGPEEFDDCRAETIGRDGRPGSAADAVLTPVDEYLDVLAAIDAYKQRRSGVDTPRVFVSAAAGGTIGDGAVFKNGINPAFKAAFGIGPGCNTSSATGYPPSRIAEVVTAFGERDAVATLTCNSDWSSALACVPGGWPPTSFGKACVSVCAADTDPSTPTVEPDCRLVETRGAESRDIPPCLTTGADSWAYPEGADVCVQWLTGDDIHPNCSEAGSNVSWFVQREGPLWDGWCTEVTCTVSMFPEYDCPDL